MKTKREILDRIEVLESMKEEYMVANKKIPQKMAELSICHLEWVLEDEG
jgi:hypothetical protein